MMFHTLILGAGASGLMCAMTAAQRGASVLVVDHNPHAGRKICISGGGKANFTNKHMNSSFFIGKDTSFAKPALTSFPPQKILSFYDRHKLLYEERLHGQYFGLQKAQRMVQALVHMCEVRGCQFALGRSIHHIAYDSCAHNSQCIHDSQNKGLFTLSLKDAHTTYSVQGHNLVLALGSSAWSSVGATSAGVHFAAQWAHEARPFRPVLVPLRMANFAALTGISVPVRIHVAQKIFEESLLFTHKGVSGPAVLQASCYWKKNEALHIDFLPHTSFEDLLDAPECGKLLVRTLLSRHMPQRLADALLPQDVARRKVAELSRAVRKQLHACVHKHNIMAHATEGMHKAEAAAGGVLTQDICPHTMESLKHKGLYIVGELLDITGQLGGYNLHWAWASGFAAGRALGRER